VFYEESFELQQEGVKRDISAPMARPIGVEPILILGQVVLGFGNEVLDLLDSDINGSHTISELFGNGPVLA
jgi:hypothetical protein